MTPLAPIIEALRDLTPDQRRKAAVEFAALAAMLAVFYVTWIATGGLY